MKALKIIYVLVWFYFVYYACYMVYEILEDKAIPLFVSGGLLFLIKWQTNFLIIRGHKYD